jgi:hypothetical protein
VSAHEDDAGMVCARCGVTFDCHEVLSPECPGDAEWDHDGCPICADHMTPEGTER